MIKINYNDTCWIEKDLETGNYHGNIFRRKAGTIIPSIVEEDSLSFIKQLTYVDQLLDNANVIEIFSNGPRFKVYIGKILPDCANSPDKVFDVLYSSEGYSFLGALFNLNKCIRKDKKIGKVKLYSKGGKRYE